MLSGITNRAASMFLLIPYKMKCILFSLQLLLVMLVVTATE